MQDEDNEQYHFLYQGYGGTPHLIYKILDTDRLYYRMSKTDPKYYEIIDVIPNPTPSDPIMIQFITSPSSSTDIDIPTTYVLTLYDDNDNSKLIIINNVGGTQQSALWQKFIRDNTAYYQELKRLEYNKNKGGKRKSRKSKKHKKSKKHTKIKKTKRRRPTKKRR